MTAGRGRYRRSRLVPFRLVGDEVLLAVSGQEDVQLLSGPAAAAWVLLASPATARSLTETLARVYRRSVNEIRGEVEQMLDSLVASGGLERESGRG